MFLLRYDGWGQPLRFHETPVVSAGGDRPLSDDVHGRSLLKLPTGDMRLECRFETPLSVSYFGAGLCRLLINPSSINVGFNEASNEPIGIYLHDPDNRKWLQARMEMPPITQMIDGLPSLVMPTVPLSDVLSAAATPVPPALAFTLKLALPDWRSENHAIAATFTGPPLLEFKYDDMPTGRGGFAGGFAFNPAVFTNAPPNASLVDLTSVVSHVAGAQLDLSDLVGAGEGVSLMLTGLPVQRMVLQKIQGRIRIPIGLRLEAGNLGRLAVPLCLELDPVSLRVVPSPDRRILFFLLPNGDSPDGQVLDFKAAAIGVPSREDLDFDNLPTDPSKADGYVDCLTNQFVLLQRKNASADAPRPWLVFPGDLPASSANGGEGDAGLDQRMQLSLLPVNFDQYAPDHPLAKAGDVLLAVGKAGVTFRAKLETQQSIALLPATASLRAVELRVLPQGSNGPDSASEIVFIDNQVVKGQIAFDMDLPGFENASIRGELKLSQSRRGKAPAVVAAFDIRTQNSPICGKLGSAFLRAELSEIRPTLKWDNGDWDVEVLASGAFVVADGIDTSAAGTFKEEARLTFESLNLTNLHAEDVRLSLAQRDPAVNFSLLGGKLACRMGRLDVRWNLGRPAEADVGVPGRVVRVCLGKLDDRGVRDGATAAQDREFPHVGLSFGDNHAAGRNQPHVLVHRPGRISRTVSADSLRQDRGRRSRGGGGHQCQRHCPAGGRQEGGRQSARGVCAGRRKADQ